VTSAATSTCSRSAVRAAHLNGRKAVSCDFTVRTDRPEFDVAADYAREVMRATGVRRVRSTSSSRSTGAAPASSGGGACADQHRHARHRRARRRPRRARDRGAPLPADGPTATTRWTGRRTTRRCAEAVSGIATRDEQVWSSPTVRRSRRCRVRPLGHPPRFGGRRPDHRLLLGGVARDDRLRDVDDFLRTATGCARRCASTRLAIARRARSRRTCPGAQPGLAACRPASDSSRSARRRARQRRNPERREGWPSGAS
jgi:hypothetical protein